MTLFIGILEEGLIYAIMALGVYITYKILDFPDLSVDSTFPMGAALTASAILGGINPVLTLFLAFGAGALAGCVTGLIHVPIFSQETIFENGFLESVVPQNLTPYTAVVILAVITLVCKVLLDLYLKTRSGYLLRAVGDNETLVTSLAKDKGMVKIVGLAIANGFAALAGCIYCQHKGFFEISVGTGTMVIGLANVIIGTQLLKRFSFIKSTTAVIFGSIVYKACVSFAISKGMTFGLEANDLKLITAVLFLIILVVSTERRKKVKERA